jgi:hypothetical protein
MLPSGDQRQCPKCPSQQASLFEIHARRILHQGHRSSRPVAGENPKLVQSGSEFAPRGGRDGGVPHPHLPHLNYFEPQDLSTLDHHLPLLLLLLLLLQFYFLFDSTILKHHHHLSHSAFSCEGYPEVVLDLKLTHLQEQKDLKSEQPREREENRPPLPPPPVSRFVEFFNFRLR